MSPQSEAFERSFLSAPRRVLRLVLFVALAALAVILYNTRIHREMADFAVFRNAATRVVRGEPLYRESDGHYQFKYLPAFALIVAPLGALDESTSEFLWFAVSIVLLIALLRITTTALPEHRLPRSWLIALTIILMGKFYARELLLGQTNLLLGVLLVLAIVAVQQGRGIAAGVLVALAVFVKPYALILLPWLLLTQGWRPLGAAIAVVSVGLALPAVMYGWDGNLQLLDAWWRTVSESTAPNLLNNDNVSIAAMWAKWIGVGSLASTLAMLTLAVMLILCLEVWRQRRRARTPDYLECALLMLLIPLISPQGWDYVLLLATPAVVCVLDRSIQLPRSWQVILGVALAIMGLTMFDLLGRELYARFMQMALVTVCALALAAGLAKIRRVGLA